MKFSQVVFLLIIFLISGMTTISAQVSIDPVGVAVSAENEDTIAVDVTLTNNGETDILYTIDFDEPPDEERGQGPRRDQPEGTFALFQDTQTFAFVNDYVHSRIDGLDYEWFRNADDLVDVDLDDYTALWVETGNQSDAYKRNWDGNLERFEDYVSHGGVMFIEQGHNEGNNITHTTPGGLDFVWDPQDGILAVGPDDNWLVDQMGWRINQQFPGGSFTHVTYPEDNLDEIEDCDWYQVIAVGSSNRNNAIVIYEYGRGYVIASGSPCGHQWANHSAEGRWGSCGEKLLEWMSLLSKPGWIMSDPEEGVIEANNSTGLEIIFTPIEMDEGVYEMNVLIELAETDNRDELDVNMIMISAIMSLGTPVANVSGVITDAENDNPIEGAMLDVTGHYYARFTDENGEYSAENMPLGDYEVTISATDFLTTVEDVSIDEAGDLEWNIELLHADCTPSENQFFMQLEPDFSYDFNFRVDNEGNGPLTYAVDRRLIGEANAAPFELRRTDEIEGLLEDNMLAGAVFVDGNFYISGGNNGNNPNKIYVLNTEREVVREFEQFVDDRYGMRDLAYDGDLIWGAVLSTFYGFNTDGDLINSFEIDSNVEGRALAWDPVNQELLASDISSDILAINREGEIVRTYRRPAELRIYGLGVWPDDPDGCYLYVFCRGPGDVGINAFKLDPATGEYMLAAYFDVEGRPSGIQITNQLDVYSWVIVALVQNPDRLNVWQLAARKEWFQVDINEGVIEPNEYEEFVLTLDATGLPPDNDFRGEVVFMHDGVGSETVLDVTLSVVEGRVPTTRNVDLHIGWNAVSTNLQPDNNEDVEGLVASIVENGSMIMMKNGNGDFYRPEYEFNNIRAWNSWEGFQMLMASAATLTLAGESMLRQDPIDLTQGWQIVSYYPRYEIEAIEALTTIADNLIIAKDGYGNFYLPEWDDFSNMGNMREGQGYYINVNADVQLIYVPEEEEDERSASVSHRTSVYDELGQLPVHAVTNENMSLLVKSDGMLEGEVGVYAGGELVGSGVLQNGICGIAVWGDDLSTDLIDGAVSGATLEIRMLTDNGLQDASYTILSGKLTYETDGLAVIRLDGISELPLEFGIVSAYPNPFNSQMRVSYSLLETGIVDLAAYDVSGRRVAELSSGRQSAGIHTVMFDGNGIPSGVYMLRLQSAGQSSMMKVMLVK